MRNRVELWSTVLVTLLLVPGMAIGSETDAAEMPARGSDARPPVENATHSIGNISMSLANMGTWGVFEGPGMEWPEGSGNDYLFAGDIWSCCYGDITSSGTAARYASCSDYGAYELYPGEGYPLVYQTPGSVAPEQSEYGIDDWYTESNEYPYGLAAFVRNFTWDIQGYDNFQAVEMLVTHHSEHGNPGVPLEGLVVGIRGDFDIASADTLENHLDDLVYYDGHAIWCNDPEASFEYVFDDGTSASEQDDYTYQQNPDNPLGPGDPDNIHYHYNYSGADGIPDNDVDQDGVSDHFTVLARVAGGDTLYRTDPESGIELFSGGMPYYHWNHTVGDTTYLVVPRNLSYMWDGDSPASTEDDSGEPLMPVYCNGFVGWRLLDVWVSRAGGGTERPCAVYGCDIPLGHQWWNWETDPGTDPEKYAFMWGVNPDQSGEYSGPAYMSDWVGNPNAPDAIEPVNPGPFPFVYDNPAALNYPVFDYRILQSVGPLELADGDTLHIVGGWVAGLGLDGVRLNADLLLDAYYRDEAWGQGLGIENAEPPAISGITVSPNPVSSQTVVSFTLAGPGRTVMSVYDISGRAVRTVLDRGMEQGEHSVNVDASGLGAGVYFLRVLSGSESAAGRFVVLD